MNKLIAWLRRRRPGTVVRMRDFWIQYVHRMLGIVPMYAVLSVRVLRHDGKVEDLGIVSMHAVTDTFTYALVDTLQSAVAAFSNYKYHDSGTGTTAEDAADTGLETACGEARTTGTQIEGATANIYKSVATHTYAGSFAITEHILASAASGGITMDRSVFTAINIVALDRIEFTYQLTCASGG